MKSKDNLSKPSKLEKEEAKKKTELARLEKEEATRKNEIARMEREKARQEMDAAKKEYIFEKTRMGLEALQIRWVKLNITCLVVGFTAYKFFIARVEEGKNLLNNFFNGRFVGIFLISLGFIMLLLASLQHKKNIEKLKLQQDNMKNSLSLIISYFILTLSLIMLYLVVFKK